MQLFALLFLCLVMPCLTGWATSLGNIAKIVPGEREEIGKHAAARAQKAYAPTKSKVQAFLASEAHAEQMCSACDDKDYSDMCPLGWLDELNDGRCKAPATYAGKCSKVQMLLGSSAAEKMELEITCSMCWPCAKGGEEAGATCVRDWARPCPQGYALQDIPYNEFHEASGMTCMADLFYEGECEQQVAFNGLSEKQDFAQRCQTSWPCQLKCEAGYATCPGGWQALGNGLCSAPDSYKVIGCPLIASFRGWTGAMKSGFAQKCSVNFECAGDTEVECQLNLGSCPRRWQQEGSRCAPPPDMRGACATVWEMGSKSGPEKIAWASECGGIDWPCMGESLVEAGGPRAPHINTGRAGPVDASGSIIGV